MIDFATLQGLTIPEGVVTQITDASGRVLWAVNVGGPIILEVEKITSDTYAGETSYTGEQFILLDIYPKTNGTVNVTYGGLTKTITDISGVAEPNAQQVFFGTFNGVSDSVATTASGTLTIEGGCAGFACGAYQATSKSIGSNHCSCVTGIVEWGGATKKIYSYAFTSCTGITLSELPSSITYIGSSAFYGCTGITLSELPSSVTRIDTSAFDSCTGITLSKLPSSITYIGSSAFYGCKNITTMEIPNTVTSIGDNPFRGCTIKSFTGGSPSCPIVSGCLIANKTLVSGSVGCTIPVDGSVEIIGSYAFSNEAYGTDVTIPASVTSVKSYAFTYSDGNHGGHMKNVRLLATTPPTCGSNVFGKSAYGTWYDTFSIIVPQGCGEAYKAAEGWSTYADRIVEAS